MIWIALAIAAQNYAIVVGNNQPPTGSTLAALRYADDDAAAFYELISPMAQTTLLTVLDDDSQQLFPHAAAVARAPTLENLIATTERVSHALTPESDVFIFFSGHGAIDDDGRAYLALMDGQQTQATLYDAILTRLPAHAVHLFVDACHAEAVVRPRGAAKALTDAELSQITSAQTLDRFPHVGVALAASALVEAHEWSTYRRGVFTHELISALRGAADIDGDGRIEYSELHAFLSAANSQVTNPRARLDIVVKPPALEARSAIVTLDTASSLDGVDSQWGHFSIEDARGVRLVDARVEARHHMRLALPAGRMFVRTDAGEGSWESAPHVRASSIALGRPVLASRDATSFALERGLFAVGYGPTYYRGFVDSTHQAAVPLTASAEAPAARVGALPITLAIGSGALLATSATFAALALSARNDYARTPYEVPAANAKSRYEGFGAASIATLSAAAIGAAVTAFGWPRF